MADSPQGLRDTANVGLKTASRWHPCQPFDRRALPFFS